MYLTETPTITCFHSHHGGCEIADHHSHHHSSKRKFDDYSSFSDEEDDDDDDVNFLTLVPSRMKKDTKTTSSKLQFFVCMIPKGNSVVIHASPEETVKSVHETISKVFGIPIQFQRLLYNGKQLRFEQSLSECGIQNDANLQLVGHLRSIRLGCSHVWEVLEDTVSLIWRLCKGEKVHNALNFIHDHMSMHFKFKNREYVAVFMSLKAPSFLVILYLSPYEGNKEIADSVIRHFVNYCLNATCRTLQARCLDAVLEFCKLLKRVASDDPLYIFCRSSCGFLLENMGNVCAWNRNPSVLFQGVFTFVREIADRLLWELDSDVNCPAHDGPLWSNVRDFTVFSGPLRNVIKYRQASKGYVICENFQEEDPLIAGVVDHFRIVYIQLLSKMDECLGSMEGCLANKEQEAGDEFDTRTGWSQYLTILKELYHISKLYDDAEGEFWRVMTHRKNVLSQLVVRYAKRGDDHRWILERKSITNFECRRILAMTLFPDVSEEDYGEFHEMLINRSQLLAESFEYIARAEPNSLQGGLFIEFKNEEASGPGVLREWFLMVSQELFNPQNALFVACPSDCRRLFPNSASKVHPLHLEYFTFSGRIIALALMNKVQLSIVFDRVFFMQLAGNRITLEDIQDADPYLYSSCKEILKMDADLVDSDALGLTFVREVNELGHRKVIELCPDGQNLVVTSKNREKFVDLLIQDCFVTSISEQVSHFSKGFGDILSSLSLRKFFQTLELEDLDWMLHGSEDAISVEDWRAHTKYNGYEETDLQISWFWEVVGRMSADQRKVLLFFWTSVKYLPVEGFRGLASRLYISKAMGPDHHLPSSHTCFYELCFPPYSSMATMQDHFGIITQEHIGCSFGTF